MGLLIGMDHLPVSVESRLCTKSPATDEASVGLLTRVDALVFDEVFFAGKFPATDITGIAFLTRMEALVLIEV